jgi:4-nitrophenyl phosphatase
MSKRINLDEIRAVGFDLDGVVYFGNKLAVGAKRIINDLRGCGYKVFFITNNSSKTRKEISMKLKDLGVEAEVGDIFTSGHACAVFLSDLRKKAKIFVLGSVGLKKLLMQMGLNLVNGSKCDFLVVGYDSKFNYKKACFGLRVIQAGAKFIACNLDRNFPGDNGRIFPGCGAIVAFMAEASGREPDFVIGKPNDYILELAVRKFNLKPKEVMVIGDSLETDISMANKFGSPSVLVNASDKPRIKRISIEPSFNITSLMELKKILKLDRQ